MACALHNLRMLCKLVPNFVIEERKWAILGEHIFHPKQPAAEVTWGIPKNPADLTLPGVAHISSFLDFLRSMPKPLAKELGQVEEGSIFFPKCSCERRKSSQRSVRAAVASAGCGT